MLELKNIYKEYLVGKKPFEALKDINLKFQEKEFVAILGPSGCGKTTLLNLIGGLDQYTSGDLIIEGLSTKNFKDHNWDSYRNHRVGFIFQNYNLISHLTVLQNVELSLTLSGISPSERKKRATKVLDEVGLSDKLNKRPNQLSGGEMQRVAIARSMVNKPDILLADEPTGALDSATSVVVLDQLKKISKKRLVIMVTHNRELAEKYATRIIQLKDGVVISDSANMLETKTNEIIGEETSKKTSMNFLTALNISFKNLLTKKGRTILTAIAGSIGIIGVALVLAVSNGFTQYVHKMETNTLSGFPISVNSVAINLTRPDYTIDLPLLPEDEKINVYDRQLVRGHINNWTPEYFDYVEQLKETGTVNSITYRYTVGMALAIKSPNGQISMWQEDGGSFLTTLSNLSTSSWHELLGDRQFVEQYYEVIGNPSISRYPSNEHEVVLITDQYNRLDRDVLRNLGLINYTDTSTMSIDFDDLIGRQLKLFNNDEYYTFDAGSSFDVIDDISGVKQMKMYRQPTSAELTNMFNDDDIGRTITITGILRPKEQASVSLMSTGIGYLPSLGTTLMEENRLSGIANAQKNNIHVEEVTLGQYEINFYSALNQGNKSRIDSFVNDAKYFGADLSFLMQIPTIKDKLNEAFDIMPTNLSLVVGISIFPKSFADKKVIIKHLDQWNNDKVEADHIYFTDLAESLTSSLGTMIDVISIVLIVFASISLVVSSVMIGIITYVSVIERTKEIGILRAIGARKKDIGRLFEAETVIIGFTAGVFGILVTLILTIPINLILDANFPGQGLATIASLNIFHAIGLVIISVLLTLISGLIPSRIASAKDPVVALRTE